MTTKQYLSQIERLDKNIQNKLSEIYQLKSLSTNIVVVTESERIQTSGSKDRLGDIVSKLIDVENETNSLINDYILLRNKIIGKIDLLPKSSQYQVLFSKYVEYKTLDEIAEEMHYSLRQIVRIHGAALKKFEEMFGSEYLSLDVI